MRKHTKHIIKCLVQVVSAIMFFIGFMIIGAAIDSCDHGTISILQSLTTVLIGGLCAVLGAFIFSVLEKNK